jgi:hypothetical protein
MFGEVKIGMMTMPHQKGNKNKEKLFLKMNYMEILELKVEQLK